MLLSTDLLRRTKKKPSAFGNSTGMCCRLDLSSLLCYLNVAIAYKLLGLAPDYRTFEAGASGNSLLSAWGRHLLYWYSACYSSPSTHSMKHNSVGYPLLIFMSSDPYKMAFSGRNYPLHHSYQAQGHLYHFYLGSSPKH